MRARLAQFAPLIGLAVIVPLVILLLSSYYQYVAVEGVMTAVIGLSIGVVYGMAGMLSLCQVALSAIGGWTVIYISSYGWPLPFPYSLLAAGVVAIPIGVVVGLPALRLRGVNLAVVTFGFAIALYTIADNGFGSGRSVTVPTWLEASTYAYFLLSWFIFVVLGALTIWLRSTQVGLGWLAIRRSERTAASIGVSVVRSKTTAFAVSAFIAGVGGGLLAGSIGMLDPANFSPLQTLTMFAMAVMFGTAYIEGAFMVGFMSAVAGAVLRNFALSPSIGSVFFGCGAVQMLSDKLGGHPGGFSGFVRGKVARRSGGRGRAVEIETRELGLPPVPAEGAECLLEIKDLTVKYGAVVALDGVSLEVRLGTTVGLIGPNGAGKSTLVDAVTGYIAGYGGDVRVGGQSIVGLPAFKRASLVRRTFQGGRIIPELTAREYLRLASGGCMARRELEEVLGFVGCDHPDSRLEHLDIRMRRLVQVGACLVGRPKVIVLDEPGAGLSADETSDLAARLVEIPARFGCSVLVIDHDMELVRNVCHSVVVLDFGKVIAAGETLKVLASRRVTAAYLGEELVA
jgi:branched-chain amino acid transport system permease protein